MEGYKLCWFSPCVFSCLPLLMGFVDVVLLLDERLDEACLSIGVLLLLLML
jgi:hypothetical protein